MGLQSVGEVLAQFTKEIHRSGLLTSLNECAMAQRSVFFRMGNPVTPSSYPGKVFNCRHVDISTHPRMPIMSQLLQVVPIILAWWPSKTCCQPAICLQCGILMLCMTTEPLYWNGLHLMWPKGQILFCFALCLLALHRLLCALTT